ncbi:PucR family transcriptional regulator [Microbacterium sp. NPDC091382]|uniref:PucR family transcriptional regulator n=1 Tax=Microbacterium sp. NPDC091382 TaxID=3364210 RepID=UPI003823BAD4
MVARDADPTLRALLGRRELRMRLAGEEKDLPPGALDRPTRWVHSSDLDDPTPFLADDLVLLTTGTQFPTGSSYPFDTYVRRLVDRGVAALGFGTEVARDGIPAGLAVACRRANLPLFEVPYDTPFIAVARANAEAVAAQAYARRSWALSAQRAIALAALRPDGLDATIAELAKQLDTWVGMYDAAGELVREHPAGTLTSEASSVLRIEVDAVLRRGARAGSSLRSDTDAFTLQTLGRGGSLRGVLAIAASELDQAGRDVVTAVIAMAGLALEQHQRLSRARTALRSGMVRSLLTGDPALARQISRDVWGPLPAAPIVAAVTDAAGPRTHALIDVLELRADERHGALLYGTLDDDVVIVVPASAAATLEELPTRFAVRVGVSEPVGYAEAGRALAQARAARDRAAGPGLSHFAEVQNRGILSALTSADAATVASGYLAPLRAHDRETGGRLEDTLRAWLEADGSNERAATALGVHRHTVRTRLAAAEKVLGTDLGSFAARAELWTAFHLGG